MPKSKRSNLIPAEEITLSVFLNLNFPPSKKKKFSEKEKRILRPIAEVLALLDSNPFFGLSTDDNANDTWYEQYLPEANRVFNANGGLAGWGGETSWVKDLDHECEAVEEAYNTWLLLKILAKKNS